MKNLRYYFVLILMGCVQLVIAQQRYITGTVSEMYGDQKEPCIGVNVAIVNSQNRVITGVITDMLGQYSLNIPNEKGELKIGRAHV